MCERAGDYHAQIERISPGLEIRCLRTSDEERLGHDLWRVLPST